MPLFTWLPRRGLLGNSEGLKGTKRGRGLALSFGFLGGQSNLHQLFAFLYSLLFGQIEVA
jgi:hypothetical protein